MLNNPLLLAGEYAGYQIQRSLRLRASATAYVNRTFTTPTNANIWTYSQWVKRGALGVRQCLFGGGGGNAAGFEFTATDTLDIEAYAGAGSYYWQLITARVFRGPDAHCHIVVVYDSTQATAANRVKLYVNGVQETSFTTTTYPTQNTAGNVGGVAAAHYIGLRTDAANPFDGYLSEVNFIDGQALAPSSFGQTDATTGQWTAKKYTGTYGTNGFYLDFKDTSSTANLCLDRSGNGNNWTPNNISLTAGATYDSMTDVPLAYGTTDRGNFATWSPLNNNGSTGAPTDGNLKGFGDAGSSFWRGPLSTFPVDASGNWWAEFTLSFGGSSGAVIGIIPPMSVTGTSADTPIQTGALSYRDNGVKIQGPGSIVGTAYGATYTTGDVIGINLNAGTLTFYKQTGGSGSFVSQGAAFTGLTGLYNFFMAMYGSSANYWIANFGQRPFNNSSLPTGAKSIHTGSLPAPSIFKPNKHFDAVLQLGSAVSTGANLLAQFTNFVADFAWGKDRAAVTNHQLIDTVRGSTVVLQSNTTGVETTYTAPTSGDACVAWGWKAGGAASSNTNGSITSQVSANATAGFSIATYTGNGVNGATIGHGLGVAPKMVIVKSRTRAEDWPVWHTSLTTNNNVRLDATQPQFLASSAGSGGLNAPSSTVINTTQGSTNNGATNNTGDTYVVYSFAEIPGYSKFGSYVGTANADGPSVYCGFRPRYVLVKCSTGTESWYVWDAARDAYNVETNGLVPNQGLAEFALGAMDFTAAGFKIRSTNTAVNGTNTYIFAAFAEAPFQFSLAR